MGRAATKALRSRVEGEPLEIEPIEQNDGYGRMVAKVRVRGDDVNARLVESGFAWAYRRYLRHEPVEARPAGRVVHEAGRPVGQQLRDAGARRLQHACQFVRLAGLEHEAARRDQAHEGGGRGLALGEQHQDRAGYAPPAK